MIKTGVVEKVENKVSQAGKNYTLVWVEGKKYVTFKPVSVAQGQNVTLEVNEKDFIQSVTVAGGPAPVEQTAKKEPFVKYDADGAKWGNALNVAAVLAAAWSENVKKQGVDYEGLVKLTISGARVIFAAKYNDKPEKKESAPVETPTTKPAEDEPPF